ncbi:MAG: hypothetical protein IJ426_07105 [Clostridia bacterium]|nr:hypothetical protein [Clostridia bacterium]
MQFSPTKRMKTLARLREDLCERMAKGESGPEIRRKWRQLFLLEGRAYSKEYEVCTNLKCFTEQILCSAVFYLALRDRFIYCKTEGEATVKINSRLYEIALLNLAAAAADGATLFLRINSPYAEIEVSKVLKKPASQAFSLLGGLLLYEHKNRACRLRLPINETCLFAEKINTEHLWGRYSVSDFFID